MVITLTESRVKLGRTNRRLLWFLQSGPSEEEEDVKSETRDDVDYTRHIRNHPCSFQTRSFKSNLACFLLKQLPALTSNWDLCGFAFLNIVFKE